MLLSFFLSLLQFYLLMNGCVILLSFSTDSESLKTISLSFFLSSLFSHNYHLFRNKLRNLIQNLFENLLISRSYFICTNYWYSFLSSKYFATVLFPVAMPPVNPKIILNTYFLFFLSFNFFIIERNLITPTTMNKYKQC